MWGCHTGFCKWMKSWIIPPCASHVLFFNQTLTFTCLCNNTHKPICTPLINMLIYFIQTKSVKTSYAKLISCMLIFQTCSWYWSSCVVQAKYWAIPFNKKWQKSYFAYLNWRQVSLLCQRHAVYIPVYSSLHWNPVWQNSPSAADIMLIVSRETGTFKSLAFHFTSFTPPCVRRMEETFFNDYCGAKHS